MEQPSLIEKAMQEIKSKTNDMLPRIVVHFEEIPDPMGNVVEIYTIIAEESSFWLNINNLIETYKKISGISEIPIVDGIMPLKEVPYELEGYYIRITKSRTNNLWVHIHIGKKEWINSKNTKLINEIINNCKRNLYSWENSLDIWKDTPYNRHCVSLDDDNVDIADLLELV